MPEIIIDSGKMQEAASKFGTASDKLEEISAELDETIQDLEDSWSGVSKQEFYKHFLDLKNYLESFATLASSISKEMSGMAEKVNKIESEDFEFE